MEQCDHRRDSGSEQIIDELDIELEALLVDRVISATNWDDSRPGDGKSVGFRSRELKEFDIFGGAIVGVAGYVARAAIGDFARNFAERIPN